MYNKSKHAGCPLVVAVDKEFSPHGDNKKIIRKAIKPLNNQTQEEDHQYKEEKSVGARILPCGTPTSPKTHH